MLWKTDDMNTVYSQSAIAVKSSDWQIYWLYGLILSFSYEKPIAVITQYDRINPRLFDIMFFIGIFTVLPFLRNGISLSRIFLTWQRIVAVFGLCTFIWVVFILEWEYGKFSLFYIYKYLQGLITLYMVNKIPLGFKQKQVIHLLVVIGGIFVAIYCIPEYFLSISSPIREIQITADKYVSYQGGTLLGPLGETYFHVAMFSSLAFAMAFALAFDSKNSLKQMLYISLAVFISWPALFCGARSGIALTLISLTVLFVLGRKAINISAFLLLLATLTIFLVLNMNITQTIVDSSLSLQRYSTFEEGSHNSIQERLLKLREFDMNIYRWNGLPVPFIGAGFYVAPVYTAGVEFYRVGYGVHNSYLFAFEQGGAAAFILFIIFLLCVWKSLNQMRYSNNRTDSSFAIGMFAFFIAQLFVALAGVMFWQGHGTQNFSTYSVLLFIIASQSSDFSNKLYQNQSDSLSD